MAMNIAPTSVSQYKQVDRLDAAGMQAIAQARILSVRPQLKRRGAPAENLCCSASRPP
jgi:hypothetical protein